MVVNDFTFKDFKKQNIKIKISSISDEKLRKVLASDFTELQKCLSHKLWKTSVVMIGSCIESMLFDALSHTRRKKKIQYLDRRNFNLSDVLLWARNLNLIDESIYKLCDKIRDYRNLIHPKVILREKMVANENVAMIGYYALLEILDQLQKNRKTMEDAAKNVRYLVKITRRLLKRRPTKSEEAIYLPILDKYGQKLGEIIV